MTRKALYRYSSLQTGYPKLVGLNYVRSRKIQTYGRIQIINKSTYSLLAWYISRPRPSLPHVHCGYTWISHSHGRTGVLSTVLLYRNVFKYSTSAISCLSWSLEPSQHNILSFLSTATRRDVLLPNTYDYHLPSADISRSFSVHYHLFLSISFRRTMFRAMFQLPLRSAPQFPNDRDFAITRPRKPRTSAEYVSQTLGTTGQMEGPCLRTCFFEFSHSDWQLYTFYSTRQ